jgi:ribosomal protein S30
MSDYEAARFGRSGAAWAAHLAALPARELTHPWPFPTSVTAAGLVRNVQPQPKPKKRAKGRPRMDWCRGWTMNAQLVAAGQKPNRHQWAHNAYGDDTDRCLLCKRERGELWATGTALAREAA